MLIKPCSRGEWQWWSRSNAQFWEGMLQRLVKSSAWLGFYIYFALVVVCFPLLFSLGIYRFFPPQLPYYVYNKQINKTPHTACIYICMYIYVSDGDLKQDCLACLGKHWSQCTGYYTITELKVCFYPQELFFSWSLLPWFGRPLKPVKGNKCINVGECAFSLFLSSLWLRCCPFLVNAASLLHLFHIFTIWCLFWQLLDIFKWKIGIFISICVCGFDFRCWMELYVF